MARYTPAYFSHPRFRRGASADSLYRNPTDSPGEQRHDGGGVNQSAYHNAPLVPSAPLAQGYHRARYFQDDEDLGATKWTTEKTGNSNEPIISFDLEVGEHVLLVPGDTAGDYIWTQTKKPTVGFEIGKDIWFEGRIKVDEAVGHDQHDDVHLWVGLHEQMSTGMNFWDSGSHGIGFWSGGSPVLNIGYWSQGQATYYSSGSTVWYDSQKAETWLDLEFHYDGDEAIYFFINKKPMPIEIQLDDADLAGLDGKEMYLTVGMRNAKTGEKRALHCERLQLLKGD